MIEFILLGVLMVVLLLAKGFFSGSEIALVSSDKLTLRTRADRGDWRARLVLKLFRKPERLLATTLIGTNIATMSLSVLGAVMVIRLVGPGGEIYAVLIMTPILLIFGEIVPKSIFQQQADNLAPIVAPPLAAMRTLLSPLVLLLGWIGRGIARLVAPKGSTASPFVTRQRLRLMLESADRTADIAVLDRDRIRRAIRLADMSVGEAMTPLASVVGARHTSTTEQLLAASKRAGQRSIPLYKGNLSNIVAVAVWSIWDESAPGFKDRDQTEFHVAPHFASSIQRLDELLPVLLSRTDHMAVVVDEFGTAAGIVTVDDLMEILLGDVARDARVGVTPVERAPSIEPEADGTYLLPAKTGLADIAELIDVDLPTREFHSVGGFLTSRLRRIPAVGDVVEAFGYTFTVTEATARGPTQVRIEPVPL